MFKLVTPASAILETTEVKSHLNVEHSEDDLFIQTQLIPSATRYIEKQTARQFGQATWELHLDAFPSGAIEIRKCPVLDVTEVAYTDANGDPQTLASFQKDTISEPARVLPAYGEVWPTTRTVLNAVKVTFTAGYSTVPAEAKHCILLLIGHWYANREGVLTGTISKPVEFAIEALRDSLKWTL